MISFVVQCVCSGRAVVDSVSAINRASLISEPSIRSFNVRRNVHETRMVRPAASAPQPPGMLRTGASERSRAFGELVAKLLDGLDRIRQDRQFFPQAAHVDVHGPCAARVLVAPDVGQQQVSREDASAMLDEIQEEQELFRRQPHFLVLERD